MNDTEQIDDLPPSAKELALVIGRRATLCLAFQLPRCLAGEKGKQSKRVILYVPQKLKPGHRLARIVGEDCAHKLVDHFGGEIIQLANCQRFLDERRDKAIRQQLDAGARPAVLAASFGVTARTIRNIRGNPTRGK